MKRFASTVPPGSNVLEIGSGRRVNDGYPYSASGFFPHCEFVQTDVDPTFGHQILDITNPPFANQFDYVLASSVLEHIFNFEAAVEGMRSVLRNRGTARIRVPFLYPLHDEPADYWRFTEHALRVILSSFRNVEVQPEGMRRAPLGYVALAKK